LNASDLTNKLLENERLVSLLATDPYGNPALYQILSPEAEIFPRIALFENDREYTAFADDTPIEERVEFRIDMYARENILHTLNSALHEAMRQLGFKRAGQVVDGYIEDMDIYVKSVTYEINVQLPLPWE
jgi:hypothetical protein